MLFTSSSLNQCTGTLLTFPWKTSDGLVGAGISVLSQGVMYFCSECKPSMYLMYASECCTRCGRGGTDMNKASGAAGLPGCMIEDDIGAGDGVPRDSGDN